MKRASWIVFTSGAIGAFCASMLTMPACAGAVGTAASVTAPATSQNMHKAELEQAQQKPANPLPSHTASPAPAQHRATAARTRTTVQNDTPFSFRGISLGITLSALREANMIRATPHESTLVCETDVAGGDIGMMLKSYASPTIACRWAHRTSNGWAPSLAVVAGAPAVDHVLRFAHDAPSDPLRLNEMSFVVDNMTAFDLRDLFAARYGKPHMRGTQDVPLLVWDNASSTITICVLPDGGRATLTYLLKPPSPRPKGFERALKVSQFDEG
ncbi:hypothetical protein B0G62_105257 [Paraburkholderia eburnea]|uniref:Uncharacterized protein n=1 Tax=Paraburkholderia eburnea TaxID=1189126 RepID=A0A2S4MCE2_9BURK|nr:hypothetical protein [Paraburkholderia eburnea]POR52289.1 hypothetical protein B0G62_105257 [Paraburkholderia eburnea]PRZ23180.1 hypothetical protein BX588_105257 [Paraburkholderia eburnea]